MGGSQFRPLGRNSLTTFRGQTALRGCPRARGVRCRIAPCRSLCSPPTLPAGRFGLRPRPPWGPASLRDRSLRSPAGKRLLLPILSAGLAMSRAMDLDSYHTGAERARARLFPPSKWAGLFPSAAYRRSAPPQLAWGGLTPCGLGCFVVARLLCRTKMKTFVSHTVGDERACPLWGNGLLLLGRFWKVSGQRVWGARAVAPVVPRR